MEPSLKKRLLTSVIGVPLVILALLSPNTVITVVVWLDGDYIDNNLTRLWTF